MSEKKVIAVLISDIHYTPSTLDLASKSLNMAIEMSEELRVPLVIAGDTLDSKAIIRGECANRLIRDLTRPSFSSDRRIRMLVGNHDLISEKSNEHVLNFLKPYVQVIDKPTYDVMLDYMLIPYQNNIETLIGILRETKKKTNKIIMHQGVQTAYMGHYVKDSTSLPKEAFKDFRVISGHYHRSQNIKCGPPKKGAVGLFSYIGNPYTTSFAEADDSLKGFKLLYDDGLMELVPTNLRKHVVINITVSSDMSVAEGHNLAPQDLLWVKLKGSRSELAEIDKTNLGEFLIGHSNYKLDKIVDSSTEAAPPVNFKTNEEIFDSIIDKLTDPVEIKKEIKDLWRTLVS